MISSWMAKIVVDRAVVTFRPEVRAVLCVDQLRRDADAVAALANAALQNVSDAKLLRRLADIDRTSFVNEAGIACDDPQSRQLRQGGDDVLDQTIAEIILLGIAAHVLEWQHRDRGFVRDRRRSYHRLGRGHGGQCRAFAAELDAIDANGVSNVLQALLAAIDEVG